VTRKNKMRWLKWAKGLLSAAIGGAANGITVTFVDPASFNLQEGIGKLGTVIVISAVVAMAMYLKKAPLPPEELAGI